MMEIQHYPNDREATQLPIQDGEQNYIFLAHNKVPARGQTS